MLIPYRPDRVAVLDAVKAAGLKTVRIFISETFDNNKNTGSVYMPDIEPKAVGRWDDTQLEAIDQLMIEARQRGQYHRFGIRISTYQLTPSLRHQACDCNARSLPARLLGQ